MSNLKVNTISDLIQLYMYKQYVDQAQRRMISGILWPSEKKHNTKKTFRNRLDLPISFVYLSHVGSKNSEFLLELEENSCFCSVNPLRDVRANCLSVSLLRTQLMSQHATSRTSARAKVEIHSPEGMVFTALTLLIFNSLGWSVTPASFWIDDFI